MSSLDAQSLKAARPGGRTADVSRRIYGATMDLLVEGGFQAITFQSVAERAGVARATLYRRWPSPSNLVAAAIRATAAERITIPDTGSLRGDLSTILGEIARLLSEPIGLASVIAGLTLGYEGGATFDHAVNWSARWSEVRPVFDRATRRGEIDKHVEPEMLFAALSGALYFRLIVMRQAVDDQWVSGVLDTVLGRSEKARS